MPLPRPDLTGVALEVRAYIESLEAELAHNSRPARPERPSLAADREEPVSEPSEPAGPFCLLTITAAGQIKRTARHLYDRQRRGGMGIFDLDTTESDPPALLTVAEAGHNLIIVTTQGRMFGGAVGQLAEAPVRARGESLRRWLPLLPDERIALVAPDLGAGYLTLVTQRGQVRRWRYNVFGRSLQNGTVLHDVREGGAPAAGCWSPADADLLIATAKGNAIRFAESQVPARGCLGIRVDPDDAVVGVAPVRETSGVFLLGADGKGTIRQMAGFARNKEPGSGGKTAFKTDRLVGLAVVEDADDIFVISRLSKIIRFRADEVPAKEGVVQGVNCMGFRADETVALAACTPAASTVGGDPAYRAMSC
jgi:DNA gyrase subunit A